MSKNRQRSKWNVWEFIHNLVVSQVLPVEQYDKPGRDSKKLTNFHPPDLCSTIQRVISRRKCGTLNFSSWCNIWWTLKLDQVDVVAFFTSSTSLLSESITSACKQTRMDHSNTSSTKDSNVRLYQSKVHEFLYRDRFLLTSQDWSRF